MTTAVKTEEMLAVSERIRAARRRAGHTQDALAKILGVTRGAVGQWELGTCKSLPRLNRLHEVARALNVAPEWLMGASQAEPGQSLTDFRIGELWAQSGYSPVSFARLVESEVRGSK